MSLGLIQKLTKSYEDGTVQFVAPTTTFTNSVSVRVSGIFCRFRLNSQASSGWFVFRKSSATSAEIIREATFMEVSDYCSQLKKQRFILISRIKDSSWLAFPANADVYSRTYGSFGPVVVHFIDGLSSLDCVECGYAGGIWLYTDTCLDPYSTEYLASSLKNLTHPDKISKVSKEYKIAYSNLYSTLEEADPKKILEKKINAVLKLTGGKLSRIMDSGTTAKVEWLDSRGARVITEIRTADLRITSSAGYCLDGEDRKFDFQAVVGLKEQRYVEKGY